VLGHGEMQYGQIKFVFCNYLMGRKAMNVKIFSSAAIFRVPLLVSGWPSCEQISSRTFLMFLQKFRTTADFTADSTFSGHVTSSVT